MFHSLEEFSIYVDNELKYFSHEEGRVFNDAGDYRYEYNLTDHLGNVRLSFTDLNADGLIDTDPTVGEILQEDHYYPFGLRLGGLSITSPEPNRLRYNGKELNTEGGLNWYDYGARMYDPAIGRWNGVDALAEKINKWSPYCYSFNNPILFIDLGGLIPWPVRKIFKQGKKVFRRGINSGFFRNESGAKHGAVDIGFAKVVNNVKTTRSVGGAEVMATHDGVASITKNHKKAGNYIVITNGKIRTRYLHLQEDIKIQDGQNVQEGDVIGLVGDSGSDNNFHLHYEIQQLDENGNWVKQNPVEGGQDKVSSFTADINLLDPQEMLGLDHRVNENGEPLNKENSNKQLQEDIDYDKFIEDRESRGGSLLEFVRWLFGGGTPSGESPE